MMLGVDDSPLNLGIIPRAIAWLYRAVDERRQSTGARFSVRVSAVEVTGRQETVKDLLANVNNPGHYSPVHRSTVGLEPSDQALRVRVGGQKGMPSNQRSAPPLAPQRN